MNEDGGEMAAFPIALSGVNSASAITQLVMRILIERRQQ